MIKAFRKDGWLLGLCAALNATYSFLYLVMQNPNGSFSWRHYLSVNAVRFLGKLALAAAVCTVIAAVAEWREKQSWLLGVNGLAFSGIGLISVFLSSRPLRFLPVAVLLIAMAVSMGAFAWNAAGTNPLSARARWALQACSIASAVFGVAFLILGFGLIRLEPLPFELVFCGFFALNALAFLLLASRPRGRSGAPRGGSEEYPFLSATHPAH